MKAYRPKTSNTSLTIRYALMSLCLSAVCHSVIFSHLSRQISYVTEEYCPVMGYGGVAYTRYLYNDSEWAEYVYSFKGNIPY